MTLRDTTQQECLAACDVVRAAYDAFLCDLDTIAREHGLLLEKATQTFEEKAAEKLRYQIGHTLDHASS